MKDELDWKIMKKVIRLRGKTYNYLTHDGSEDKKAKLTKKCVIKRQLKSEHYKNWLEAPQLENKINYIEENEVDVNSLQKNHKEFIKNN